jgi:Protein of unknown function (DUF3828)
MKNILFLALPLSLLFACQEKKPVETAAPSPSADSAAVAEVIHGFYSWYDGFIRNENIRIDFVNDKGPHLTLDSAKFDAYYIHFIRTGFVSREFALNEYAFFQKCEQLWQNEPIGDVPSCLDADKYFCAQDWDLNFWTQSPVRIAATGENQLKATLYASDANGLMERSFVLKKEDGKWVIATVECDMGVN